MTRMDSKWWLGGDCSVEIVFSTAPNAAQIELLKKYVDLLGEALGFDEERDNQDEAFKRNDESDNPSRRGLDKLPLNAVPVTSEDGAAPQRAVEAARLAARLADEAEPEYPPMTYSDRAQAVGPDGTIMGSCGVCDDRCFLLAKDAKSPYRRCERCRPRECLRCGAKLSLPDGGAIMVPRCVCGWELGAATERVVTAG